ncbi:MAG: cation:proton antiporter domain-containing protein [Panacagrimonas sp.]
MEATILVPIMLLAVGRQPLYRGCHALAGTAYSDRARRRHLLLEPDVGRTRPAGAFFCCCCRPCRSSTVGASQDDLVREAPTIPTLTLGLAVFTVVGAGLLIHWLIPAVPLAVAFALAAVLSPTDFIAVSAIASRMPIPLRMLHILQREVAVQRRLPAGVHALRRRGRIFSSGHITVLDRRKLERSTRPCVVEHGGSPHRQRWTSLLTSSWIDLAGPYLSSSTGAIATRIASLDRCPRCQKVRGRAGLNTPAPDGAFKMG